MRSLLSRNVIKCIGHPVSNNTLFLYLQIFTARSENAVLQAKVKELSVQVKILSIEKATLEKEKAALTVEVELYRKEAALPNFSNMALGTKSMEVDDTCASTTNPKNAFVKSGNGVYCSNPEYVLPNLHGSANPLTVALSPDESVLISGGADGSILLIQWGAVDPQHPLSDPKFYYRVTDFTAPVISVAVASQNWVAVGGMDGSVSLVTYNTQNGKLTAQKQQIETLQTHKKYVKNVKWSPNHELLATSCANGDINVYKVESSSMMTEDSALDNFVTVYHMRSLHLPGPVESLCFASDNTLLAHARGTAYLTQFDLSKDYLATEINLNTNHIGLANGGFEDHVSFTVLDMQVSPCRNFLALATDANRHIILDLASKQQLRNLYGHQADGYSSPVVAWSANGQYLYCNDQQACCVWVYDIASSKIINKNANNDCRNQPHKRPIKAIYSSARSNTLVTTSYDRETVVWLKAPE